MKNTRMTIPIFYACDDAFLKYTAVSLSSLIANASADYNYRVHILHSGVSETNMEKLCSLATDGVEIVFVDVSERIGAIGTDLPIRDYYSKTTYFRFFIAELYPELERAIYIDSDTVVCGDISELYLTDIGESYVGACHEQAMIQVDEFGEYAECVVGISRYNFFNAGILLINCRSFRERRVLERFTEYLGIYNFVVTQDEDYLNLICKDHVYWLDGRWNAEVYCKLDFPIEDAYILHYIMTSKPWHYRDCTGADIFWSYAKSSPFYTELAAELVGYTDAERDRDELTMKGLVSLAISETEREDNFLNMINRSRRAPDRVAIMGKIERYEREGRFDEDVEDDPPSKELLPDDIEYIRHRFRDRVKTALAFRLAHKFVDGLIEDRKLIIKEIRGIEHFKGLDSGAIITCNHFNAFDSFAIQLAYEAAEQPDRTFYRVIREGNYTSFPGFYGFLMRNCNTLPLSSNPKTMTKFVDAVGKILSDGNFVLVYPEQSMWWNYRKPKPLKNGAFIFAAKNRVPVLPCFITMKDSDELGEDGFFVQEYTIHIGAPIYPDTNLPYRKCVETMMNENYRIWKEIYEKEYGMPLTYLCEG